MKPVINRKQFNQQMDAAIAHVKTTKTTTDGLAGADVFALIAKRQAVTK